MKSFLTIIGILLAGMAGAQPWPQKPVKFFVAGATGPAPAAA